MKKQINPNIKAHLIRSAFYVLLLLPVRDLTARPSEISEVLAREP